MGIQLGIQLALGIRKRPIELERPYSQIPIEQALSECIEGMDWGKINGIQEARGSIPLGSTMIRPARPAESERVFLYRERNWESFWESSAPYTVHGTHSN